MVSETGHIVEVFFTPGWWNDVLGMQYFRLIYHTALSSMPTKPIATMVLKMRYTPQVLLSNHFGFYSKLVRLEAYQG